VRANELIEIGQILYGGRGWQTAMAAELEVDTSTIRRWIASNHVPRPVAIALRCLMREKQR
jgi:hypothetical protein